MIFTLANRFLSGTMQLKSHFAQIIQDQNMKKLKNEIQTLHLLQKPAEENTSPKFLQNISHI